MAINSNQSPNAFASDDDFFASLSKPASPVTPQAIQSDEDFFNSLSVPKQSTSQGGFTSSLKSVGGALLAGAGQAAKDVGITSLGDAAVQQGRAIQDANRPAVQSFSDIAERPGKWISESAGQMGGQAGLAIAGGLAGRAAGAGLGALTGPLAPVAIPALSTAGAYIGGNLPMLAQEYGSARQEQEQLGVDDKGRALTGALATTAIENLGGLRPGGMANLVTDGVNTLAGKSIKEVAKIVGKKMLRSGVEEGLEEIPQEFTGAYAGGQDDLLTAENMQQGLFGAVSAFPGGALFGAGKALGPLARASQQAPVTPQEAVSEAQNANPNGDAEEIIRKAREAYNAADVNLEGAATDGSPTQVRTGAPTGGADDAGDNQQTPAASQIINQPQEGEQNVSNTGASADNILRDRRSESKAQANTGTDESTNDRVLDGELSPNDSAARVPETLPPLAYDLTQKTDAELEVLRQNTFNVRNSESLKRRAEIVAEQKRRKTLPPQEETQDVRKQERPGNFGTENQSADSANRQRLRAADAVPMERDSSTASGTGEAPAGEQQRELHTPSSPRITDERQDANAETGQEAEQERPLLDFTPTHRLNDGYDTPVRMEDDGSYTDRDGISYTDDNEAVALQPQEVEAYREQEKTQAQNQAIEAGAEVPAGGIERRPDTATDGRVSNVSSGLLGSDQGPVAGDVSRSRSGVSELGGSHEFAGKNNESTATISAIHSERELAPQTEKAKVAQQVEASGENANNNVSAEQNQNVLSAESVQKNRNTPSILNESTQNPDTTTSPQPPAQDANTPAPGAIANPPGTQAEPMGAAVQPVLSKQGKPFSTKKVAQLALESSAYPETKATHEIVKVEGGYGLVPRETANENQAKTKTNSTQVVHDENHQEKKAGESVRQAEAIENAQFTQPILTQSKSAWINDQIKAQGLKEKSPGYLDAKRKIVNSYDTELDKAAATLTFDQYKALPINKGKPEPALRVEHEYAREQYGEPETVEQKPDRRQAYIIKESEGQHPVVKDKNRVAHWINKLPDDDYYKLEKYYQTSRGNAFPSSLLANTSQPLKLWDELRYILAQTPATPEVKPKAETKEPSVTEAKRDEGRVAPIISKDDISYDVAYNAYRGISFDPEKRAKQTQDEYVNYMQSVYDDVMKIAKTDEQRATIDAAFENYRKGYIQKQLAHLQAKSRTLSPMITGPANFPTRRNEKANNAEHKRLEEFLEWDKKALARLKEIARGTRSQEEIKGEQFEIIRRDLASSLSTIKGIDNGTVRGSSRSLLVNNLTNRIKTLARNGKTDLVNKALDYIDDYQKDLAKPLISPKHSVWDLRSQVAEQPGQVENPTGTETIKEYQGASVVNNRDAERVQILFDEKPSEQVRNALKKAAFKWSPSNNAWQRQNTPNGIAAAKRVLDGLYADNAKFSQSQPTTGSTVAELTAQLDAADKKLLEAGKLNIVQRLADVPKSVLDTGDVMTRKNSVVAWHGSPHDHNKFDSSKIGTGEGAQAFGYGHYFTDKKEIAEWYRDELSSYSKPDYDLYIDGVLIPRGVDRVLEYLRVNGGDFDKTITHFEKLYEEAIEDIDKYGDIFQAPKDYINEYKSYLDFAIGLENTGQKIEVKNKYSGKLYQVELAPNEDEYLDWDKPLSEQSEKVKAEIGKVNHIAEILDNKNEFIKSLSAISSEAGKLADRMIMGGKDERISSDKASENWDKLKSLVPDLFTSASPTVDLNAIHDFAWELDNLGTGMDIYNAMSEDMSEKEASDYLHSLGIRGIKYKAEQGKSDAYNYVIFSDDDITIKEKYSRNERIEGFYKDGKVWVISENVAPENLQSVLRHEYLHAALDQNQALRDRILGAQSELRDIFAQVEAGKYTGRYKALYDEALRRVNRAQTSEADRFEEWLAYQVTQHNKSPQSLPERLAKAIQNLVAAIKAAIYRYSGVPVGRLSPADLSALAKSAMNYSNNSNGSSDAVAKASKLGYKGDDTGEALEWIRAKEKGLDMSHEARMERARAMGFYVNQRWYHGTTQDIKQFKPSKQGIFFTKNANFANTFAEYGKNNGNIIPVFLKYGESFDYENKKDRDKLINIVFKNNETYTQGNGQEALMIDGEKTLYTKEVLDLSLKDGGWSLIETPEILNSIRKLGYDSYYINENDEKNIAVFNDNQIRSIHAAFDPAYKNSGNILASVKESPDIRYSIADDVRESAEKLTANLVDRLSTDKTFNWWHKTVGTQFHKALVDKHFGKVFNRSMQFEQDMARLANEAADLAPSLLPKLDALSDVGKELKEFAQGAIKGQAGRRMIDARKIGEAVFQTTLQDKPMTEKELIDAGYTESQRTMYHEFFAAVNRSLDDLAKSELFRMARALKIGQAPSNLSLKDTANWYAEQAEDANQGKDFIDKAAQVEKLKKQGYAPLMRFGQYTLDVVTPKADGTEKREFFGLFETEQEAKEMEKAMRAEYPDSNIERGVMSQNDWQMFKGVTPETMEVFAKMMNVEQDEAFQAYLKSAVTNRSAMKRLIHRKKMPGFAKDTQRILASFLTSNARAASKNYHLGDLVDAISTIPKAKGDVIDEAVELYNYVQNPSAKGAVIRGLMFAWYLGGSVSSAAVNLTQSFTTTLPYLHQFGDTKQVSRLMGQAMKLAANHRAIQGDLANALKLADEEGITDPKELHMLYGESMRTGMLKNQFLRPLSKAWGSFFSLAETYNRRVAFIAAYNLAKETNQPGPFQFAANAVNETQFVYNKSSRPNWARSTIGSTVFTFKTFTINYLEFLKRLPAKERVIALGVLVAFAGLSGAPGADDLDDLIDTFGQAMGYNTNSKAWKDRVLSDFIGKEAAQYALYGLSHGLPIDVSSRLSVGNIIPGSSLFKKSEIDKSRDVMEFAGPAGSLSKRIVDAFEAAGSRDSFTGQASAVGRAVIPKAMSDLAQAIDMQITGQYRDTRGRKVAEADLPDVLAKALGFQPTSVAEPRRAERYLNQSVTMAKTVEADIAGLWASGIVEQNRDKVGEAKAMLKDWNDKNPETPIKVKLNQVLRRVKQMRMTSGERLLKSTPKEIRRYAREALND
jgi:hypothetical protein